MSDHGIAFAAPMVLAFLAGGKACTRRLVTRGNSLVNGHVATKEQWEALDWRRATIFADVWLAPDKTAGGDCIPTYTIRSRMRDGDTFYVREGLQGRRVEEPYSGENPLRYVFRSHAEYVADGKGTGALYPWTRSPLSCRFMPRDLARIRGSITSVTPSTPGAVCTPEEALAEGLVGGPTTGYLWRGSQALPPGIWPTPEACFRALWESLHGEWTPDAPTWRIGLEVTR